MSVIKDLGIEPPVDKRRADDQKKLRSKWISEDLEKRLIEQGGFSKPKLYNRRGSLSERGLASLMEQGDNVQDVKPGEIRIQTREGTVQTFYDLEAEHDWLRRRTDP
jgi:hypothetical protein